VRKPVRIAAIVAVAIVSVLIARLILSPGREADVGLGVLGAATASGVGATWRYRRRNV
jgi:hypothetical protein